MVPIVMISVTLVGCDSGPAGTDAQLDPTPKAAQQGPVTNSHGATGTIEASATYRAVDTKAAKAHGLKPGEQVGTLHVTDDGSSLIVTGEARGLDDVPVDGDLPFIDGDGVTGYWSLFYDKASSAQGNPVSDNAHPGANACEPGVFNPDHPLFLTLGQMAIGPGPIFQGVGIFPGFPSYPGQAAWDVDANGDATLGPATTLEYVPVKKIGTVSIRDGRFLDPANPEEQVVACGVVTRDPAGGPPS